LKLTLVFVFEIRKEINETFSVRTQVTSSERLAEFSFALKLIDQLAYLGTTSVPFWSLCALYLCINGRVSNLDAEQRLEIKM
jgi:hypothetical protein